MGKRSRQVSILLPGEKRQSRRSFLVKGVVGTVLLAAGGSAWLATRQTSAPTGLNGPFSVFSPQELAVLMAIADRLVPVRAGFPRPASLDVAARMDGIAALADPDTQRDLRRLVNLFESSLAGLLLDAQPRLFTACSPQDQDRRLAAWARSRIALRRTGHKALRRLALAAYYSSPGSWSAVGYAGPPIRPPASDRVSTGGRGG